MGQTKEAIEDYDIAIGLDPKDEEAYFNRANAKADLNDDQGAIADYTKALAINPRFTDALYNRVLRNIGPAIKFMPARTGIMPENLAWSELRSWLRSFVSEIKS